MLHRWAFSRSALGLAACVLFASSARGQTPAPRASDGHQHRRGVLSQNDPNPFSHHTTIPFRVGDEDCAPGTQHHVVTLRIYNILSQVVAFATLSDTSTAAADSAAKAATGRSISELTLACGSYVAQWDGTRPPDHREAPAGVYMYQLLIDGHPTGMRKMVIAR
jgi:hypothetical protein